MKKQKTKTPNLLIQKVSPLSHQGQSTRPSKQKKDVKKVKAKVISQTDLPVSYPTTPPAHQDLLKAYLMEVRKYPVLSLDEERKLAIKYFEEKDLEAARQLVRANLRFVIKIATEYARLGSKMIDLIQEGNVGLMHAVREYNPYKGVRLISYAVWWIRGYIREYLLKNYSQIKIATTRSQKKLFYNLQNEINKLEAQGYQPNIKLLSQKLNVPEKDVKTMQVRMSSKEVSLDHPLIQHSELPLQNLDQQIQPTDEMLALKEELSLLQEHIEKVRPHLNEKELYLLDHRFLSDRPQTLQQIGKKYKISRERVRQIEHGLLQKLRSSFSV